VPRCAHPISRQYQGTETTMTKTRLLAALTSLLQSNYYAFPNQTYFSANAGPETRHPGRPPQLADALISRCMANHCNNLETARKLKPRHCVTQSARQEKSFDSP